MYPYEKNRQKDWKPYIFLGRVHFFLLFWNVKNSKKVHLYEKNSQKEWKTYIFLGRVHFFYFEIWKRIEKKCTLTRRNSQKFPRKGTLFCYFEMWKIVKKSVPLREKQSKGVKSIHFPRKGTFFFLLFFQVQFWSLFFSFFFPHFFSGYSSCHHFFTDFSLINCFMFSRGWLKFPCTRITHQHFFGDRVVLDGLELSFLALSISARWVLSLIRLGSAPDTFNTE